MVNPLPQSQAICLGAGVHARPRASERRSFESPARQIVTLPGEQWRSRQAGSTKRLEYFHWTRDGEARRRCLALHKIAAAAWVRSDMRRRGTVATVAGAYPAGRATSAGTALTPIPAPQRDLSG